MIMSYSTTTPVLINPAIYFRVNQVDSSGIKVKKKRKRKLGNREFVTAEISMLLRHCYGDQDSTE